MKKSKIVCILLAAVLLLSLMACAAETESTPADSTAPADGGGNEPIEDFFVGLAFGGLDATPTVKMHYLTEMMDELGWRYVVTNGDLDFNKYVGDLESLVQQNPDLILTRPVNDLANERAVQIATEAGIPIIIMASMTVVEGYDYLGHVGDPELLRGIPLAHWLNDYIDANPGFVPKIGFLVGNIGIDAPGILHRSINIREELTHPWEDVITTEAVPNWMASGGMSVAEDWLQRYTIDEMNTYLVWSDEMAVGVVQALQSAGKEPGEILVLSYDGLPLIMDYVEQGWVSAASAFDLRRYSEVVIDMASKVREGRSDEIDFLTYAHTIYILDQSNVVGVRDGTLVPDFWDYSALLEDYR